MTNSYGQIMFIPVVAGDVLSTSTNVDKLYFLPAKEAVVEGF